MLKEVKAVIFDVDGTIADSMWMWKKIDIEYLGKFGIPLPEDLQRCIEGMSFHETAVYFKENFGIGDSLEQIKLDWNNMAEQKYQEEVTLKKGVRDFFEHCHENGVKLGIATSNSKELLMTFLKAQNIEHIFDSIKTGSDGLKGKPEPDVYLAVARELNISPEHCLVFEDILPGIMAGKNAGMKVCAVYDLYSEDVTKEKKELADYYIEDFNDVISGSFEIL